MHRFILTVVLATSLLLSPALLLARTPASEPGEASCTATILDPDTAQTLYRMERNEERIDGFRSAVTWTYVGLDGRAVASETIRYEGDTLRSYEMHLPPSHERARVTVADDNALRLRFQHDGREKTGNERYDSTVAVNDQLVGLLHDHWASLMAGETVEARVVVPNRAETIWFSFEKVGESRSEDDAALVHIEMEPRSALIALLVDSFHFTFERDGARRLLEYRGITTPKRELDGRWEELSARVLYDHCFPFHGAG